MPNRVRKSSPTVIDGVMLSRTLAPSLPNNLITRKHLFKLLSEKRPGATLIIAPAGYGKTTLVTEWVKQCTSKVIWTQMNSNDSLIQLSQHMIQSVRNVVPDFAPWANSLGDIKIEDIVRKTANEIFEQKENFIWVLDSAEELDTQSSEIRRVFVESIPENVHVVLISRKAPDASYSRFAKLGNLNLVTPDDLLFSSQETASIAELAGLDMTNLNVQTTLDAAKGWPAAVQLLIRKLQKGINEVSIPDETANKADPLSYLSEEILKSLRPEELETLPNLSIVEDKGDLENDILFKIKDNLSQLDFDEALRLADRIAIMKDGIIEQLDTPANIVLKPATEYVRKFTEEVPREKVLKIEDIMDKSNNENLSDLKVLKDEIIENVAEKILNQKKSVGVIDKNDQIVGIVQPSKIINTVFGGKKNND